jgi:uncharacterized protein (TIGR02284 family)
MMPVEDAMITLNGLAVTCQDSERGFMLAQEGMDDERMKEQFAGYARQRARLGAELQTAMARWGGPPRHGGDGGDAVRRYWGGLKTAIRLDDSAAVLDECEQGEEVARDNYQEALKLDLPLNIKMLVQRQYAEVKSVHEQIVRMTKKASRMAGSRSGRNVVSLFTPRNEKE